MSSVKPPKTYSEQVDILITSHGLIVPDREAAENTLKQINYYHLRGYYIHWMDSMQEHFLPGITFPMIIRLQEFDQLLRILLMYHLQHIELAMRTHIGYYIAHMYGPFGHLDSGNFMKASYHDGFKCELYKDIKNSHERFIEHFKKNYNGDIPVWAAVELLSFGSLSKMFRNMKSKDKKHISSEHYKLDGEILANYLNVLSVLRNICAHCGRIYNRCFAHSIKILKSNTNLVKTYAPSEFKLSNKTLFAYLLAMKDLLPHNEWLSFATNLNGLLTSYKDVAEPIKLGMPDNWQAIVGLSGTL